jgi:hypothetical protein
MKKIFKCENNYVIWGEKVHDVLYPAVNYP